MKLITYNVNGIRAAETKGLSAWLIAQNPDVIGLQEIKAFENQFDWTPFFNSRLPGLCRVSSQTGL